MTNTQRELAKARREEAFAAFCHYFRLFGGQGWWSAEKILLPPPARQFVYDACHSDALVVVEFQGGIWMERGGHNTGKGITRDVEKLNFAHYAGYAELQLTTDMLKDNNPAEVFLPLVKFVNERAEMLKAMRQPELPDRAPGKVGVF